MKPMMMIISPLLIGLVVGASLAYAQPDDYFKRGDEPVVNAYLFHPFAIDTLDMPSYDLAFQTIDLQISDIESVPAHFTEGHFPVEESTHKFFRTNPVAMAEGRYVGERYFHPVFDAYCAWVIGKPGETVILRWPYYIGPGEDHPGRYVGMTIVGYITHRQFVDEDRDRLYLDELSDDEFLAELDKWFFDNLPEQANCSPLLDR